ncbi:MAG: acyl-CoA thioesterase [Bacteriovoracia bacterium]
MEYSKEFEVRWADLDPNWHLKNTAYEDYAAHVRFSFLNENGFPFGKHKELKFAPVIFSQKYEYFKEIGPEQKFKMNYKIAGLSQDGRKYRLRNEVIRSDGAIAARITIDGSFLDLTTRKLRPPPNELFEIVKKLDRTDDFEELT